MRPNLRPGKACRSGRARISCTASASGFKPVTPRPPYTVVVTGSTKGIGRALAEEFLKAGDTVLICSRSAERVAQTAQELGATYGHDRVRGKVANVGKASDAKELAEFAATTLGRIDLWVNNAGSNGYRYGPLLDTPDSVLEDIVETNVLGVMLSCREAIRVMARQSSCGHIFNMDGAGADGSPTPRFAAYGATKRSLSQLGKSLNAELAMQSIKNVVVHNLSPGMVTTDLLMTGADTPTSKFFINCLAEPAEDVARTLVPQIRDVPAKAVNALTGGLSTTYIQYLTKQKAYSQIIMRLLTGARKNRFVTEDA